MYKWRNGARVKVDAGVAQAELERIRQLEGGDLDAEAVVNHSQDERAVLHQEFEWDDAAAAKAHREDKARHIMRCLVVVTEVEGKGEVEAPRYVCERRPAKMGTYSTLEEVMKDPDRRAAMLDEALRNLMQWRAKYRHLQELALVFRAHDEVLETVEA